MVACAPLLRSSALSLSISVFFLVAAPRFVLFPHRAISVIRVPVIRGDTGAHVSARARDLEKKEALRKVCV